MKRQIDSLVFLWNSIRKPKLFFFKAIILSIVLTSVFPNELIYARTNTQDGGTLTGQVKDASGELMPGVTVIVKGTTNGTITDINGNYSLSNVPENSIIIFSFIGMTTQEVAYTGQKVINVVLSDETEDIEEVVVVGYGTVKKSDLTGSVSTVSPEKLTAKGTTTMMESMQGQVAGVDITQNSSRAGAGFDIQIRGNQSINNSAGPLYVVDGIVVSDIQMLNPADIERIDVLKDASSTAIYGSRASEGVVLITTKSAKGIGGKSQKPVVSYDGYVGVRKIARMPDFMGGMDFMKYRFARYTTDAGTSSTDGVFDFEMTGANLKTTLLTNYTPEDLNNDGILDVGSTYHNSYYTDPDSEMSVVERMMMNGEETNWRDLVTQTGMQQNHFVAVSGSSEKVSYHFGFGYQQDKGIFLKDEQNRYNLKTAIDANISKLFSAGISINAARTIDEWGSDDAVTDAFYMNPYMQPYDSEGNLIAIPGSADALNSAAGFSSQYNPLLDMKNTEFGDKKFHALGNIYIALKPVKSLSLKSTFSPYFYSGREHFYQGVETADRYKSETDYAYVESANTFSWTWDNQLDYSYTYGDHSFSVMGLFSMNKYTKETFYQYGEDFPSNTSYYNMGTAGTVLACKSSYTENSLMSYAARLNYSFKGKYMFTGTIRADGSSRFAEGNKWGSFPSAALAWRASEESFMQGFDWLSNLKLRLSYGVSGNNNVDDYATATMPSSTAYYTFGSDFAYGYGPNGIVNSDLKWEKTREIDFGIDLSVLNQRVNMIFDVYNKDSKDLILKRTVILESGNYDSEEDDPSVYQNIGEVTNKGIEISLNTVNVKTKDWRWETTFSFAKNKNRIEDLYGDGTMEDTGNNLFVGEPVNVYRTYKMGGIVTDRPITVTTPDGDQKSYDHAYEFYNEYYGLNEGEPYMEDLNNDGTIDDDDKSIIGYKDPKWTGSFSTTVVYKNLDLSMSIYTKQDYMVNSKFLSKYEQYSDRGREHINMDYYIPAGAPILLDDGTVGVQESTHYGNHPYPNGIKTTNYGVGSGGYYNSIYYYEDASFTKIKNISLGYTVPVSILERYGLSYLRVYANVLNPFVFTDCKGFDPEWAGSDLKKGGPSTITYQFGVNLKF